MDNYPLLLGYQEQASKAVEAYIDGFQVTGATQNGECIDTAAPTGNNIRDLDDPVIRFNTDLSYGCQVEFTYDDFKKFCQDTTAT